ncbi:MAG: cell division protein FtsX [Sphingomonas sp.]
MSEDRPERRLLDADRSTRTMRWIMAIMLFLTVLAAALALGTLGAAQSLDRQLAGRLTVQVVEADPAARDRDAAAILRMLRADPAGASATMVPQAQLAQLLKPWLGTIGNDPDLPMPALIDVDLHDARDRAVAAIAAQARGVTPAARIDRHARWMAPVSAFMNLLTGIGAVLVLLMALATGAVVVLAARAGLETHRATIEVMHMLGSTDVQVARLFQRRIARETATGGAIGTIAALALSGFVGLRLSGLGSSLLGGVALAPWGWLVLLLLPLAFVLLATFAARIAVLRALGRTL